MKSECSVVSLALVAAALSVAGCGGDDGKSCSITEDADGVATLSCPDGSKAVLTPEAPEAPTTPTPEAPETPEDKVGCTAKSLDDGRFELTCPGVDAPIVVASEDACSVGIAPDANANSYLYVRASEVEGLRGCKTLIGTVVVEDAEDLAAIASVRSVYGGVWFTGELASITLPNLQNVLGSLGIGESLNVEFSAPELSNVFGTFSVEASPDFERLNLPKLRRVQEFQIYSAPNVTSLSLPALEYAQSVSLEELSGLTEVSLPKLAQVAYRFSLSRAPELTKLDLSSLDYTFDLFISDAPNLLECPDLNLAEGSGSYSNACGHGPIPE